MRKPLIPTLLALGFTGYSRVGLTAVAISLISLAVKSKIREVFADQGGTLFLRTREETP